MAATLKETALFGRDLTGRTALVTGGGSGIGLATTRLLAGLGATVAVNHLPGDAGALKAIEEMASDGLDVRDAPGDIGDRSSVEAMVATALCDLGRLDWLVNNAGGGFVKDPIPFERLDGLSDAFWQQMLSVNLLGAFHCARAAAPALRESRGAIINVASLAASGRSGTSIPYSVTKGGLVTLTHCLAKALAPKVRVNAVAPGFIDTPMTAQRGSAHRTQVAKKCLMQRAGTAEEVAEVIAFLCLGAGFITGEVITIDGGRGY